MFRKYLAISLGSLAMAAMLSSCSQYALVNSNVYNNADLADYHTFRIVTPAEGSLPPGMQLVTYYNIAAAIREQMVERGYTEDPASPILVNIGLTVKKELATEQVPVYAYTQPYWYAVPPTPVPPPPAPGPGPAPVPGPMPAPTQGMVPPPPRPVPGPVYNGLVPYYMYPRANYIPVGSTQVITGVYREGVLSMDIVNMQEKLPLYSSSVATILDSGDTQFRDLKSIAQAVQVLFSKFPVPVLPQYK